MIGGYDKIIEQQDFTIQREKMKVIDVKTRTKEELIDLTPQVRKIVRAEGLKNGTCTVYIPHTTAGVTINENADPSVRADILMILNNVVSDSLPFEHAEGNSPAHAKASLIGSSVNIIVENGYPVLGTWQGIFFCEFDGPRDRKVLISLQGSY